MVKIEAIVKPFRLPAIKDALLALGVQGLTVLEVQGFGRQRGRTEVYRGAEYDVSFVPKMMVVVVVPREMAEEVVDMIIKNAYTGKIGDGKIFISSIDEVIRIRTRETGPEAL